MNAPLPRVKAAPTMQPDVASARTQLVVWWLAHFARTFGENAFRVFVFAGVLLPHYARQGSDGFLHTSQDSSLTTLTPRWPYTPGYAVIPAALALAAVSVLPALVLAPLSARRLARSGAMRSVLVGATLVGALAVSFLLLRPDAQTAIFALGLLAISSTVYGIARRASVETAARQAGWTTAGVNIMFTLAGSLGVVSGCVFTIDSQFFSFSAMVALFVLSAALLLTVRFPIAPPSASVASDMRGLLKSHDYRVAFAASVCFLLVVLGLVTLAVAGRSLGVVPRGVAWFAIGVLISVLQRHPHRARGWVPLALFALFWFVLYAFLTDDWTHPGIWICSALVIVPLRSTLLIEAGGRQPAATAFETATAAGVTLLFLFAVSSLNFDAAALVLRWGVPVGVAAMLLVFGYQFSRHFLECALEVLFLPLFRIRGAGPGLGKIPMHGPVLFLANHAAWLDPLWLGKVIPGRITPMMTARFFDLPVLSFFMRKVVKAIRVPEMPLRREAPELQEAIKALQRGECVMIFPEGYLRRKEEQPLRRFGRGVWEILKSMPGTPIVTCWVEGGWGSFTSYAHGAPPTKGKKMDWMLPVRIGVNEPFTIDPALLEDHHATRLHLMHQVASARLHLGLPPIELPNEVERGDREEKDDE